MKTTSLHLMLSVAVMAMASGLTPVPFAATGTAQAQQAINLATPFNEWRLLWTRKAETGSLVQNFDVTVLKTYEPAPTRLINPQPGDLFVYVNTGGQNWGEPTRDDETNVNKHSRVNVINARTKELIASQEMVDLPGRLHTSAVSPDGRFAYVPADNGPTAALFKVDALTLQPLKLLDVGGTIHHIQVFQDKYLLIDTFSMKETSGSTKRATFLLDPETDTIIGGIRSESLGGNIYTSWVDPKNEFIYLLMEPTKGGAGSLEFRAGAIGGNAPYWVAKVDPKDWSVVAEYPYPGLRSDWIQFDADGSHMFVNGSTDDSLSKINLETGEMVWRAYTGVGPYGIEVNADGTEVWTVDKGESWKGHAGRTITVVSADKGVWIDTIMSDGRGTDHVVLSPDGTEMWTSANDSGSVIVVDAITRKPTHRIPMPGFGDPHGVVFVAYDANGVGRVVADQGDFHGGVDPRNGNPLR